MAFPQQESKLFNRARVESITPGQVGVYGLFKQGVWVYVGRGDIRGRLLDHLNGDNACIAAQGPTSWVDEVTSNDVAREKQLIAELTPACNQRVG